MDHNNSTNAILGVPSIRSYCIGLMLIALCIPGLIGNILVSYIEIKKGLLTGNNSSMYKLSFNMIIAETVHLGLIAFILGPSSVAQNWLIADNWTRQIPGTVLMIVWYNALFDLCFLSLNRYLAICKPHAYSTVFSKRNTKIMIAISWIGAIIICVIGDEALPCCKVYFYYLVYSYAFPYQTGTNYNNGIILIPFNTFTSLVIIITYALVIYNIRMANARIADKVTAESQQRRRRKEIRYAFQLLGISAVFVAVWVLFNILSNTIPPDEATNGYFSIVIILEIINGSANSFVCIFFNKEINGAIKQNFCCWAGSKSMHTGSAAEFTNAAQNQTKSIGTKSKGTPTRGARSLITVE